MKNRYKIAFSAVLCLSLALGGVIHIQAQPLTLPKLLTGLRSTSSGMSLPQKNEYITLRVSQLGVSFKLSPDIEKQLRSVGASPQLIETIRAVSAKTGGGAADAVNQSNAERLYASFLSQAHDALESGQRDLAIANFTRAINIRADDARNYFYRGLAYYLKGDFASAAADFRRATELDPKFKSAFNNLGLAYQRVKQHQLAVSAFNRTIELDNGNGYAYNNRGQLFSEMGNYTAAVSDYDKAIALSPNAIVYGNRGYAFYRLGKIELALADFDESLEMDSKYTEGYLGRGNIYFDRREYDLAVADLSQAIKLSPRDARLYNNRAAVYAEMRKYELAAADLRQALQLDPNSPSIKRNLDLILRKINN